MPGEAIYFDSPAAFRAWLESNHASERELLVGFWKRATGRPSPTWSESVDQALCFGWIDGVRRSVDDERYTIRFTPRRPTSIWSRLNLEKYAALDAAGLIAPAGRAAFEARDPERTDRYSFERENVAFSDELRALLDADPAARRFFDAQPKSYREPATWYVMSAKREETRRRRMAELVRDSAAGLRIKQMRR